LLGGGSAPSSTSAALPARLLSVHLPWALAAAAAPLRAGEAAAAAPPTPPPHIGACLCVVAVAQLKLPSLRAAAQLLAALFVYDVVMVFGTPLLLRSGESRHASAGTTRIACGRCSLSAAFVAAFWLRQSQCR
jgi:hypothetical protein